MYSNKNMQALNFLNTSKSLAQEFREAEEQELTTLTRKSSQGFPEDLSKLAEQMKIEVGCKSLHSTVEENAGRGAIDGSDSDIPARSGYYSMTTNE